MDRSVVVGIDTSCDETSVGMVNLQGRMLANIVSSQASVFARYGGVVPEMAAREHMSRIRGVYRAALDAGRVCPEQVAGIAVTRGPGLSGCLGIGIAFAKGLGVGLDVPVVGVDHVEGHIYAAFLAYPELTPPFGYLVASGGHTQIGVFEKEGSIRVLGETRDDAAGEALDKGAKLLGFPYPGGPALDKVGMEVLRPLGVAFPRPCIPGKPLSFSFSGLKTALAFYLERTRGDAPISELAQTAGAAYLDAVLESLVKRVFRLTEQASLRTFVVCGGVAASRRLRQMLQEQAISKGLTVQILFPPPELCTDNGAMIARAGLVRLSKGHDETDALDIPR